MLHPAGDPQTAPRRNSVIPLIHALAGQIVEAIQGGRISEARDIVRQQQLPPIAWGYLASRLQQQHIPAETIEQLFG